LCNRLVVRSVSQVVIFNVAERRQVLCPGRVTYVLQESSVYQRSLDHLRSKERSDRKTFSKIKKPSPSPLSSNQSSSHKSCLFISYRSCRNLSAKGNQETIPHQQFLRYEKCASLDRDVSLKVSSRAWEGGANSPLHSHQQHHIQSQPSVIWTIARLHCLDRPVCS
jgi:hypothetical protein